ncbi:MAG: AAA family ATPase [Clostridia bacterium]|nr:AAA family ATPase [Clostridia bacterium]
MIILIGESGSGKTTILNELEKRGYKKAINHTTRAKRPGEENNAEYVFTTKDEFNTMWDEGKLLQRAEFNNEYYGISSDSIRDDVACIQIVDSIADVKERAKELGLGDKKIVTFYISVPAEERTKRMLLRGDSLDSIQKRLEIDNEKFKNVKEVVDFTVENDILEDAVNEIIRLDKETNEEK